MRLTTPITTSGIIAIIQELNGTLSRRLQRKLSNSAVILEPYSSEPLNSVPDVILNKARQKISTTRELVPEHQLDTLKRLNALLDQLTIPPSRKTPSPLAPCSTGKKPIVLSRSTSTQVTPTAENRRDTSSPCTPEVKHKSSLSSAGSKQSAASSNAPSSGLKQRDLTSKTGDSTCTKPSFLRLHEPAFPIDRAQSTYATLTQTMKNMPVSTTSALLSAWQHQLKQWNRNFTDAPLFFGSAHGQRLLRTTYHYMTQSKTTSAAALIQTITAKHPDKTQWQDVANYFLKGMSSIKKAGISFEALSSWTVDMPLDKTSFWNGFAQDQLNSLPSSASGNALSSDSSKQRPFTFNHLAHDITRTSYRHKPDSRNGTRSSASLQTLDLLNRRACKFLLTLAAYHHRPIVYALDQLNPIVAAKGLRVEVQSKSSTKTKVPVCSSELRFLFRHADFFQSNVFFFQCLQPARAPWLNPVAAEFWAEYALHLTRKLLLQHLIPQSQAPKMDSILSDFGAQRWGNVIRLYHSLKPTSLTPPLIRMASKKKAGQASAMIPSDIQTQFAHVIQSLLLDKIHSNQQFVPITKKDAVRRTEETGLLCQLKASKQPADPLFSVIPSPRTTDESRKTTSDSQAAAACSSRSATSSM